MKGLLHGVNSALEEYTPQSTGVASAAWAPPLKFSLNVVNGTSGVSSNVVVSCPVCSLRWTLPTSFRFTPSPEAVTSNCRFGGFCCNT